MLRELRVRDLGVIDDLRLELAGGMTALTGETGAGKTLIVDALGLVLGAPADPAAVRAGAEEAWVEAVFDAPDGDEGDEVILARRVPRDGRARGYVDGRMASAAALGELGERLVELHGQRAHTTLRTPAAQRRALDAFSGTDLAPLRRARRQVADVQRRLDALGGTGPERDRELDLLRHQVAEIEGAALEGEDEVERLEAEAERLGDVEAHRRAVDEAVTLLEGDGADVGGARDGLAAAGRVLAGRSAFSEWADRLRAAAAEVADVASDLRRAAETWDDDPTRLAAVHERLRLLADLRRKYGPGLGEVASFGQRARTRLEELAGAEATVAALHQERQAASRALAEAEAEVGRVRRRGAPRLAAAVEGHLGDLAMAGARLEVSVADRGAGEPVVFSLGANPGEPVLPLAQVASGGELARAMLALRLVAHDGPVTAVFDEVDAGVGGEAALALGRLLRATSRHGQVLVVTHLAQVAACADHQVAVTKETAAGRTHTTARLLDEGERVVEISRMLSGHPDSAAARAHADELLSLARR